MSTSGVQETANPGVASLSVVRAVLTVFMPFSGGYFLSYLFRSTNAVIAPQLVDEIGLTAGHLGLLTAIYFVTFSAFQLPLGLLLDRFGPRRVQAVVLLGAALGAFVFSIGESLSELVIGRALIGFGVAGGLMASFKAITLWFDKKHWPLVNGWFMAIGGLGAAAATSPLEAALQLTDWRGIFAALAIATVCVSALIILVVPEKVSGDKPAGFAEQIRGLAGIYRDRLFWRLAPVTFTGLGANLAIQGLWAGPWMRDVAGYDRQGVADGLFGLAAMMTIGFVVIGAAPGFFAKRGYSITAVMGVGTVMFIAVQAGIALDLMSGSLLPWLAFGLICNVAVLSYAQISSHFPITHVGRAITAMNVLAFGFVFLVQYGIGAVIDLFPLAEDGGYRFEAYRASFGVFIGVQILAFLWYVLSRNWARTHDAG